MNTSDPTNTTNQTANAQVSAPSSRLSIVFTGSGREYWRIWIVNLLLTLLTLSLYYPWARARRLRYFYSHMQIGGAPLGFHGDPKKMFRGFALIIIFFIVYSLAQNFSPSAGFIAFLILAFLWPALFKSAMQFRLANTSWHGLRFQFRGTLQGAYRANVPLFIPAIFFSGMGLYMPGSTQMATVAASAVGVAGLLTFALLPWLIWNLKQYQHNHYSLSTLQTEFKATASAFYWLFLKLFGVYLLLFIAISAVLAGVVFAIFGLALTLVPPLLIASALLTGLVAIQPYLGSRLQNLIWSQTGNASVQIESTLRFRSLLWLTVKNLVLMLVTLGLYWPFAAVALTRLHVQAVHIKTDVSPESLIATKEGTGADATGDASGDFFGFDVGL